jgi:hypothetical protein
MSALPPKADIVPRDDNVCFVPKGDILPATHGARAPIPERPTVAVVAGRWLLLPGAPMK